MRTSMTLSTKNRRLAKMLWGAIARTLLETLADLTDRYSFVISLGDLMLLDGKWYVTHTGLLGLAHRKNCRGIHVENVLACSDYSRSKYAFKATVYTSRGCKGFVGFGDADPSNVSPMLHGAEMRIAETRAVNRAMRKAYGIGICSVEEIGSVAPIPTPADRKRSVRKLPPESANGNHNNGHGSNGNTNGVRVRDRLCQVIRQHALDAELVKAYAIDFCGTKTLREASREQVENFVAHLSDWAAKDRDALLCQLNSYSRLQAGAS